MSKKFFIMAVLAAIAIVFAMPTTSRADGWSFGISIPIPWFQPYYSPQYYSPQYYSPQYYYYPQGQRGYSYGYGYQPSVTFGYNGGGYYGGYGSGYYYPQQYGYGGYRNYG